LGNVLRFRGENTREIEKSVKLSLGDFLLCPTGRFRAPFTAKPGHISQSPRSVSGVSLRWETRQFGTKTNPSAALQKGLRSFNR
jgi:hypothetical protein